jgi:hypothetical protein
VLFLAAVVTGQDSISSPQLPDGAQAAAPSVAPKHIVLGDFVDAVIQQERSLSDLMQGFNPIIETYIQEQGSKPRFQKGITPNGDDYFLSRLNLAGGSLSTVPFADEETWNQGGERYFVQDPLPFNQLAVAQALFPDLGHFDRQNYSFAFVRWEVLGAVRCAALDVIPRENAKNRGFVGRIWVEDQNFGIVRFKGTFTSKGFSRRAFHFDSWRLNILGNSWMPAYVYTEEARPDDPTSHKLWFKAQTRVWGYGLQNAGDHRQNATEVADKAVSMDSKKGDSPDRSSVSTEDESPYLAEDMVVERSQVAGLMAREGDVDRILQTVLNNLLITNDLNITGLRCRVLLTAPLESFVMGRTIVLSRGLLDVLPDEPTLATVLAHELAHVVLGHAVSSAYLAGFSLPFPESQIFGALDFHFDRAKESEADRKGFELFSKSPYKDQAANASLFLKVLDARSARFPVLLHGRFSNDFGSSHLIGMQTRYDSRSHSKTDRPVRTLPQPLGSRIVIDPWSDRIEMLKARPVRPTSEAEKIPFEVTPFYPHLERLDKSQGPASRVAQ